MQQIQRRAFGAYTQDLGEHSGADSAPQRQAGLFCVHPVKVGTHILH